MEWFIQHQAEIYHLLNLWFLSPSKGIIGAPINTKHVNFNSISIISQSLLHLAQNDIFHRFENEFKLFDRLYVQSQFQIRSFPYLPTLRKLRQSLKKFQKFELCKFCTDIFSNFCSPQRLITQNSFESLQFRFIGSLVFLLQIQSLSADLVELLTEEISANVFIHFPIVFISLSSTISEMSKEMITNIFSVFCTLRTFDEKKIFQFPKDTQSPEYYLPLPWIPEFEVELNLPKPTLSPPIPIPISTSTKIDLKITGKPISQNRNIKGITKKPKSTLGSLGF